jgi:hypothetical protein
MEKTKFCGKFSFKFGPFEINETEYIRRSTGQL